MIRIKTVPITGPTATVENATTDQPCFNQGTGSGTGLFFFFFPNDFLLSTIGTRSGRGTAELEHV